MRLLAAGNVVFQMVVQQPDTSTNVETQTLIGIQPSKDAMRRLADAADETQRDQMENALIDEVVTIVMGVYGDSVLARLFPTRNDHREESKVALRLEAEPTLIGFAGDLDRGMAGLPALLAKLNTLDAGSRVTIYLPPSVGEPDTTPLSSHVSIKRKDEYTNRWGWLQRREDRRQESDGRIARIRNIDHRKTRYEECISRIAAIWKGRAQNTPWKMLTASKFFRPNAGADGLPSSLYPPAKVLAESKQCPICLQDFASGTEMREMNCGHWMCKDCASTYFLGFDMCPCCRGTCNPDKLTSPYFLTRSKMGSFSCAQCRDHDPTCKACERHDGYINHMLEMVCPALYVLGAINRSAGRQQQPQLRQGGKEDARALPKAWWSELLVQDHSLKTLIAEMEARIHSSHYQELVAFVSGFTREVAGGDLSLADLSLAVYYHLQAFQQRALRTFVATFEEMPLDDIHALANYADDMVHNRYPNRYPATAVASSDASDATSSEASDSSSGSSDPPTSRKRERACTDATTADAADGTTDADGTGIAGTRKKQCVRS